MDYWGSRLADKSYEHNTDEMIKSLKNIYKNQAREIQDKITELYLKMIGDEGISTTNLYAYGRYSMLIEEINNILLTYGEKEINIISGGLEEAYREVFEDTSKELNSTINWGLQNTYIMEEVVNANFKGAKWSDRVWNNRNELCKKIEKSIQDIVASGMSKDKAVKRIMKTENTSFSNADRLVRTETMRVINDGQKQSYINAGYTKGYYIFSKDDRNCDYCERISNESRKNPLLLEDMEAVHHPRCRCTIRPIVESTKKIKNKSSNTLNIPTTNNKVMNKAISEFSDVLEKSKGTESHVNKMKMYLEYSEFIEDNSRNISFWYDMEDDSIRFNPKNESFKNYDFNFAQCHEITHKMDINEYRSWENKEFVKAIENAMLYVNENKYEIEKLFLNEKYNTNYAFSDIISALSRGNIDLYIGHDKDYWKNKNNIVLEVFANISTMDVLDNDLKETFITMFSGLFEEYRRIVNG